MYRHWTAGDAAAAAAAAAAATEIPEAPAWPSNAGLTAQDLQMRAAALGNLGYNSYGAANASPYLNFAPGSNSAALFLHQQQQAALQQQALHHAHHAQERAKAQQVVVQQQQALQQKKQQQIREQKRLQNNDVIEIDETDSDEEEEEPAVEASKSKKDGKSAPASTLALKAQTAKPKDKEASTQALKAHKAKPADEEDSSDDLQARRKRGRARRIPEASHPAPAEDVSNLKRTRKKQLMTVVKDADQPVVVVQNWSREGLMQELARNSQVHKDRMRESIFLHATGYTSDSAPESLSFPPKEIKMSSFQVEGLVANLVKDQFKALQNAVDATFYKCAHYVNDMRVGAKPTGAQIILQPTPYGPLSTGPSLALPPGQSANIGASAVAAETAGGASTEEKSAFDKTLQHQQQQLIKKQQEDMLLLRQKVNKLVDEKKRAVESFRKEETYLKDQVTRSKMVHGRSVRAYMKASASSLQWLRERVDGSDDDESGDEDQ
jgi:hypothetical protein